MAPARRRLLTMVLIVSLGTVLILFDVSLILLLTLTAAVGLVLMGASSHLKKLQFRFLMRVPKEPAAPPLVTQKKDVRKGEKVSFFRGLRGIVAGGLASYIKRRPEKEKEKIAQVKKIDEMLDTLVGGKSGPAAPITPIAEQGIRENGREGDIGIGPLKDLSTATLEEDLLAPSMSSSGSELPVGNVQQLDLASDAPALPFDADVEADEVGEILKAHEGDLEDLKDLGEIDLSGIGLEESDPTIQKTASAPSAPRKEVDTTKKEEKEQKPSPVLIPPQVLPSPIPQTKSPSGITDRDEMLNFAKGSQSGDDLLLALKSDVSQIKKPKDLSLFRGMQDTTVTAQELNGDLEQLSSLLAANTKGKENQTIPQGVPRDRSSG